MTAEAKVGMFSMSALLLAIVIIAHLGHFTFGENPYYKVNIIFRNVNGLKPGSQVCYAGVDVGKVERIETGKTGAVVVSEIKSDTHIPDNSIITIASDGLVGEKFVSIDAPAKASNSYIKANSTVYGTQPVGIDALLGTAVQTLNKVDVLLDSFNRVVGNRDVQNALINSATNIESITANMDRTMDIIANMASNNQGNINEIVRNLQVMTGNMTRITATSEEMLNNLNGNNGAFVDNIKLTAANLADTSQKVSKIVDNLMPVAANPQTAQDLAVILHNAKDISVKANKMMGRIDNIKVKTGIDTMYSASDKKAAVNADIRIMDKKKLLLLGADNIGNGDLAFNAQIGQRNSGITYRAGMVDNRLGVGIDTYSKLWGLSSEMSGIETPHLKLRATYNLAKNLYLLGQVNNVNRVKDRTTYFGLRKEF